MQSAGAANVGASGLTDAETAILRSKLGPREELRWSGRPTTASVKSTERWFIGLALVTLAAGAAAMAYAWHTGDPERVIVGFGVAAAGLAAIFLVSVPISRRTARNTIYAVTSERALILGSLLSRKSLQSWRRDQLKPVVVRGFGDCSDVLFAEKVVYANKRTSVEKVGFLGIPDPGAAATEIERLRGR